MNAYGPRGIVCGLMQTRPFTALSLRISMNSVKRFWDEWRNPYIKLRTPGCFIRLYT